MSQSFLLWATTGRAAQHCNLDRFHFFGLAELPSTCAVLSRPSLCWIHFNFKHFRKPSLREPAFKVELTLTRDHPHRRRTTHFDCTREIAMNKKFRRLATTCTLGLGLLVLPSMVGFHGPFSPDSAFAGNGNGKGGGNGGGNGHAGGGGNGGGNGGVNKSASASNSSAHSSSHSVTTSDTEVASVEDSHGKLASKLGALNAAHASAQALAHASPNSRVGKIAAYRDANAAALTAATTATETANTAVEARQAALAASPVYNQAVLDAQTAADNLKLAADALAADATNSTLIAARDTAANAKLAADTAVTTAEADAIAADPTVAEAEAAADAAEMAAKTAEADAVAALEAAANKPVTPEVRNQVDTLLAGK
jgi:hypothetical protein